MNKMHCGAMKYYRNNTKIISPTTIPIPFPAQRIAIFHNNSPVVTNVEEFLQSTERTNEIEDYFHNTFDIDKKGLAEIDTYTMGRVIQRNRHRHFIYSKIIHGQLNTMTINKRWNLGSDLCPICHKEPETWHHMLNCRQDDPTRVREEFIKEFRKLLNKHKTYPPLRDYFIDCIRYPSFDPPEQPLVGNPRYANLIQDAYSSQTWIGWTNFYRGYISVYWKKAQYKYIVELNFGDIHAIDKWCRMITQNILEFSRLMWNKRCTKGRIRKKYYHICEYLKRHPNLIRVHKHHLIQKTSSYFDHQPPCNLSR